MTSRELSRDPVYSADGPPARVERTCWAPEVIHDGAGRRMHVTEIDGIPDRWPGFARRLVPLG